MNYFDRQKAGIYIFCVMVILFLVIRAAEYLLDIQILN